MSKEERQRRQREQARRVPKEVKAARQAAYRKRHPYKINETVARRRLKFRQACPSWVKTEDLSAIYLAAHVMTELFQEAYSVDHIVPLHSPTVSGLHVPANLRVITASDNASKANRFWPNMP
jgi:hypothetical protein